jgi:two-component system, OmpR family, sensor histidine kinase TctE
VFRNSLRLQLLAWLALPVLAVIALNVWTTYQTARDMSDLVTERTLHASARAIAEQLVVQDGVVQAPIPPVALEMFATGSGDRVYYRVQRWEGRLLAGYPDLPEPAQRPGVAHPTGWEAEYRDQPIRMLALAHPVVGLQGDARILVEVGVTQRGRDDMMRGLWLEALHHQLRLMLVAGIVLWLGLGFALAPVLRLRAAMMQRPAGALDPIPIGQVPRELAPLVDTLNNAMQRLRQQLDLRTRFLVDAAHQLRTPLTLLSTQAAYARRVPTPSDKDEGLDAIQASVQQMTHLVNQLLTLSRAEPGLALPRMQVDLVDVVRHAFEERAPLALARSIDLGFEGDPQPALVEGNDALLHEMVVNLVDNAIRYTPQGGTVTASLAACGQDWLLAIEDSGPGIPAAARERVFERFYRPPGEVSQGSGLGLAIVRQIVDELGGSVTLREPASHPGLRVEIRLPASGRA